MPWSRHSCLRAIPFICPALRNAERLSCETIASMDLALSGAAPKEFQSNLLAWFRTHRRELPWRASRDPYRIWIAEVMLQQTRIAAVIRYYDRFLARFPDFESLAAAPQRDVLKLWSGLGYYSRARNLHAAAKEIVAHHSSKFPRDLNAALALPGIGVYTAAAVLSIAYDVPLAVLDGNVARVLARITALRGELRTSENWSALTEAADAFLVADSAGDWNQALMELGEVICMPKSPTCLVCPVVHQCRAYALGITGEIPEPRRKRATVEIKIAAAVLLDPGGRTLLVRDPGAHDDVLFSRMWQFPAVAVKRNAKSELASHLRATLNIAGKLKLETLPAARHGVTFRDITLEPYLLRLPTLPKVARSRVLSLERLGSVPISSATRKIAAAASNSLR
jgi:A/G-specific adenine glycosylase